MHLTGSKLIRLICVLEHAARLLDGKNQIAFSVPLSQNNSHTSDRVSSDIIAAVGEWYEQQSDRFGVNGVYFGTGSKVGIPEDKEFQKYADDQDLYDINAYTPTTFPLHFDETDYYLVIMLSSGK